MHRAEAEAVARQERARRLVEAATGSRPERARALLALVPADERLPLDAALVLGEDAAVRAALEADPALAGRSLGARGWLPLLYVTHSAFLGTERTAGLLACAEALLAAGADPDASFDEPERGPQSALYGAAGKAHEPRMTALLLAAGANPDDNESLYHAVAAPDTRCLRLLLERAPGGAHQRAAQRARPARLAEPVRLLLEHLPAGHHERRWALQWAVAADESPEVVRLLVEHGADLEALDEGADRTPYGLAVRMGRRDLAELLAELGAERRVGSRRRADRRGVRRRPRRGGAARRRRPGRARPGAHGLCRGPAAGRGPAAAGGRPDPARARGADRQPRCARWHGAPPRRLDGRGGPRLRAAGRGRGPRAARHAVRADAARLGRPRRAQRPAWRAPGGRPGAGPRGARVAPELVADADGDLADWLAEAAAAGASGAAPAAPRAARPADEPDYAELEWRAEAAYLRRLATAPAAAARPVGDGIAVRTGLDSNAENGVVCSRDPGDLEPLLAWLDAPAQWLLAPPTEPPDLLARLVAAGAIAERTAVVMGAQLGSVPPPGVIAPDTAIVPVREREQLDAWMGIAEACRFVDPGGQRERWTRAPRRPHRGRPAAAAARRPGRRRRRHGRVPARR